MYVDQGLCGVGQAALPQVRGSCSTVCPRRGQHYFRRVDLDITIDSRLCVMCELLLKLRDRAVMLLNRQPENILADHGGWRSFYLAITLDGLKCPEPCPPLPAGESHSCGNQRRRGSIPCSLPNWSVRPTACPAGGSSWPRMKARSFRSLRGVAAPSAFRSAAPRPFDDRPG